jgi:hypothetical protein
MAAFEAFDVRCCTSTILWARELPVRDILHDVPCAERTQALTTFGRGGDDGQDRTGRRRKLCKIMAHAA